MGFAVWSATSFGLGFCRPASGTWGSLPPAVVAFGLAWAGLAGSAAWYGTLAGMLAFFCWACLAGGASAERRFGKKDPSQVVADETAGMALVLLFMPPAALSGPMNSAIFIGLAFVLWRVADILKPWPANGLQRLGGGLGILIDDLIAAVYAGLVTLLLSLPVV